MNSKLNKLVVAGMAAGLLIAGSASAAEATIGLDVNSAYVWRGLTVNDSFVAQPSLDVAHPSGLGFNVWGNFDLDDYTVDDTTLVESSDFSEVDLTISYAIPEEIENADFGVGVIEYLFPGGANGTREVYAEAGMAWAYGFSGGAFLTYDFDEVQDFYGNLSVAYGYELYEELSLGLEALIGFAGSDFAEFYSGGTSSGFHEYQFTLSADYAVSEVTSLGAFMAYTGAADSEVLASTDTDFLGGLNVYYSF